MCVVKAIKNGGLAVLNGAKPPATQQISRSLTEVFEKPLDAEVDVRHLRPLRPPRPSRPQRVRVVKASSVLGRTLTGRTDSEEM